jgi:hypothetical protein
MYKDTHTMRCTLIHPKSSLHPPRNLVISSSPHIQTPASVHSAHMKRNDPQVSSFAPTHAPHFARRAEEKSELRPPTRSPAPNDHSEALADRSPVAQHTYFASLSSHCLLTSNFRQTPARLIRPSNPLLSHDDMTLHPASGCFALMSVCGSVAVTD